MLPELHPACAASPPLSEEASLELTENIRAHGQIYDIILMPDGRLLDGRERWIACERLGLTPRCKPYDGKADEVLDFVVGAQTMRKNVTKSALLRAISQQPIQSHGGDRRSAISSDRRRSLDLPSAAEIAEKAGSSEATMRRFRRINERAADNVLTMVDKEEVSADYADLALATGASKEEQAAWTPGTVAQLARGRKEAGKGQPRGPKPGPNAKPKRSHFIPFNEVKFPSWEETGFPVNGTLEEKDAHMARYGRTPLHPQVVKHLLEQRQMLTVLMPKLAMLAQDGEPDAAAVIAALDAMLAWKPQPDPNNHGYGIKFAKDARDFMRRLDKTLETAADRVIALRDAFRAWKAEHAAPDTITEAPRLDA